MSALSPWKQDFPIFTQNAQSALYYLDSAATSLIPKCVVDAISHYHCFSHANSHKGLYQLSANATEIVEQARQKVANFIGADSANDIIFTSGATQAIHLVAQGFVKPLLEQNSTTVKNIVISALEHHANLLPWQALSAQFNCQLRIAPITNEGLIDQEALMLLLDQDTLLLAITEVSNVLGIKNPINELCLLAKKHHIPVLVDGAQTVAHHPVNVSELSCDFYVFSAHKMYGGSGCGVLYATEKCLQQMQPTILGGGIVEQVSFTESTFIKGGQSLEAGSRNVASICALVAAIDYIETISWPVVEAYFNHLSQYLYHQLNNLSFIEFLIPKQSPSSLLSFKMIGVHSHDVASMLDGEYIAIRAGHHCAQPLHKLLQITSSCRVSLGLYNDEQDINRLIESLTKTHQLLAL